MLVRDLALSALDTRTSHREVFSFCAGEMIRGGEGEVLVEYVDPDDVVYRGIIRRLADITQTKSSAYLVTEVPMPVGGSTSERIQHSLVHPTDVPIDGFPGLFRLVESMRASRSLKAAQLIRLDGSIRPVFLEWVKPAGAVYIFGAGHVGTWVARLASYIDFKVIVLDDRCECASLERLPEVDEVIVLISYEGALSKLPIDEDSYLVIVTRDQAHDKAILEQALRTPARYIGMMGSRRKSAAVFRELLDEGFSEASFQRVHSPIGLHIGGETPEEVAVSIIAEIIEIKEWNRATAKYAVASI